MPRHLLVDRELSRCLERAEGLSGADFVQARASLNPAIGATWQERGGAVLLFDGPASPVTQTFGLGMTDAVTPGLMDEIEAFYAERATPVFHEVSPIADDSALAQLNARGYQPVELTNVMFQALGPRSGTDAAPTSRPVVVRRAGVADADAWVETAVEGWSEFPEYAPQMRELSRVTLARSAGHAYLALIDGEPVGTGSLAIVDEVALLAGASTIPRARRQGAQLALLHARLRAAVDAGCTVAMMCARPGSASQRNAERHGFRIAYTRIKWGRRQVTNP